MLNKLVHKHALSVALSLMSGASYGLSMDDIYNDLKSCSPELISKESAVMLAEGSIEMEKAKRLPTFSLSASGTRYASDTNNMNKPKNDSAVTAQAQYTLYSFGKQAANEELRVRKLAIEQLDLMSKSKDTLTNFLLKNITIEKLKKDIAVLESIVDLQQKIFERVERRAKFQFTSETDRNVVFSKVLQNRNAIRENQLQLDVLRSEVQEIACTPALSQLSLDDLPREVTDIPVNSNDFLNTELAVIEARLTSKLQEVEAVGRSLYPDLDVKAEVPVGDDAKDDANIGLQFNVSYGNMGKAQFAQVEALHAEVDAITRELETSSNKRLQELERLEQQIATINNMMLDSQAMAVDSLRQKLTAKERLFKAGRVSLFELINVYDEFLSEQLKLNRTHVDLQEARVKRAANVDFIFR